MNRKKTPENKKEKIIKSVDCKGYPLKIGSKVEVFPNSSEPFFGVISALWCAIFPVWDDRPMGWYALVMTSKTMGIHFHCSECLLVKEEKKISVKKTTNKKPIKKVQNKTKTKKVNNDNK